MRQAVVSTAVYVKVLGRGLFVCLLAASGSLSAKPVITLGELLTSASQFYPKVLEARQRRAMAEAQLQSAEGGYDWQLEQKLKLRPNGYYDGSYLENKITRPLQTMNARLFAQYRISEGDLPIYEQQRQTQSGGEASIGLSLSLLQGRRIDSRRFELADARLEVELAGYQQLRDENQVLVDAAGAYMAWLLAARQQQVYQNLVATAELRQQALRHRVTLGDRAEIELLDQRQELLKRRAQLLEADNALQRSAAALSLYWRDARGRPSQPTLAQLPAELPTLSQWHSCSEQQWLSAISAKHPQLQALLLRREQIENRRQLQREQLLPRLDLQIKLAQDMGSVHQQFDQFESVVGLELSVPLQRRQAKGRIAKLDAELRQLDYNYQGATEQLRLEVINGYANLQNSAELSELVRGQADLTEQLRLREYQRFSAGASDTFRLNLREQISARAAVDAVSAGLNQSLAALQLLGLSYQIEQLRADNCRH